MTEQYEAFKTEILKHPNVQNVTATASLLTNGKQFTNSHWRWEGKNPDEELLVAAVGADFDFFETFNMEILSGRSFSKDFPSDTAAVIVNEAAATLMGFDDPLGKKVSLGDNTGEIIGLVRNYHLTSLHEKIEPLIIFLAPYCNTICARISSENVPETISYIQKQWGIFNPGKTFEYSFLDEALDDLYWAEERIGKIVTYFTYIAIFISCLGLFGLAAFTAELRTKEIGVRKVLGATVSSIVGLLTREFVLMVVIANFIAWPLSWYAMNRWLQNFAYCTELSAWIFPAAGLLVLIIALATVSYQAVKAASADPVKSLRYE